MVTSFSPSVNWWGFNWNWIDTFWKTCSSYHWRCAGDPVLSPELLRGVWQRRRDDVRRRDSYVLLPGENTLHQFSDLESKSKYHQFSDPEAFREESKVSIPGHQQVKYPSTYPKQGQSVTTDFPGPRPRAVPRTTLGWSGSEEEIPKKKNQGGYTYSTYYIQSENVL